MHGLFISFVLRRVLLDAIDLRELSDSSLHSGQLPMELPCWRSSVKWVPLAFRRDALPAHVLGRTGPSRIGHLTRSYRRLFGAGSSRRNSVIGSAESESSRRAWSAAYASAVLLLGVNFFICSAFFRYSKVLCQNRS